MSLSISKSKIVSFNSVGDASKYMLNGSVLDHADYAKYLGITLCNQIVGSMGIY